MSVKVERKENDMVEMEVTVGREEFEKAVETAFRRSAHKINVPGFRHGKAPRKIIEKMYGGSFFYEDAVDISFPAAYEDAVAEYNLDPIERPDINITAISGDGYTFTASVRVAPEVKLGEYKGVSVVKNKAVCTDEDINAELERLRTRNARVETSEEPLEDGDTAVIDFEGFVDDTPFDGGKAENHSLTIGSGQFIPGFEEQLIGKKAGDSCDVNVTFPEEYHAEQLAGKPAVFKVTVREAKRTLKPELDDEFAKDVSEFDTLDEFKEDIKKRVLERRETEVKDKFESDVLEKMLEGFEAVIPDIMVEEQLDSLMRDLEYRVSMQGLELEQYLQLTGQSMDELRGQQRGAAERHVKCDLAFRKIAELEGFTVTEQELADEYAKLAERYRMPEKDIRKAISERSLKRDLLGLKGSEFLIENASELAPPAPKPRAPRKTKKKEPVSQPETETKGEEQ
ncbi:MAG: trigger factor [Oscillospiraceae bacterium]|nr:trigger factor [Oscillospiraceae bacterium]